MPPFACLILTHLFKKELSITLASRAKFVIGHSVGEISALTAAGSMTLVDAVRLAVRAFRIFIGT